MDRRFFSSLASLKKLCDTPDKRKAYNRIVNSFAADVFIIKDNFVRLINALNTDDKLKKKIDTIKNARTILEIALAYIQMRPEGTLDKDYWISKATAVGCPINMLEAFNKAANDLEDKKLGKYGKLIRYVNEADEIYKTLDVFNPEQYIKDYYRILRKMSLNVGTYSREWHEAIKSAAREIGSEVAKKLNLDSDEKLYLTVYLTEGGNWNENKILYSGKDWSVTIRYKYDVTQGKLVPNPGWNITWSGSDASKVQKQIDLGTLILDELTDAFKSYGILDAVIIALSGGADRSDRYKVTLYSEWTKMLQEITGENLFIYGDKLGGWGSMSSGKGNFTVLPLRRKDVGSEKSSFLPDPYFREIVDRLNGFKKGMAKYVKSSLNSHYGFQYIALDANKFLELWDEFHPKDKKVAPVKVEEVKEEPKKSESKGEVKILDITPATKKLVESSEQKEKMQLWHEGKRNFNFKSANDDKLIANYIICLQNGFDSEASKIESEAKSRGIDLTKFVTKD